MSGKDYKKKDPLFGAALLLVSIELRGSGKPEAADEIVKGVFKDLGITKKQVDRYIREHHEELVKTCRERNLT